ncbi:hypothetical protein PsorP6_000697 [Peronosclerospora sorghi]|uniref:Uncharacterized protein n=1 Tax=Peronosclerospora sorghi TaxID=230839 RepID=A0ACC0WRG8_9STRA|nr:hypothetical protein PsorP6_000697 [Peronosclerospora sorghi]
MKDGNNHVEWGSKQLGWKGKRLKLDEVATTSSTLEGFDQDCGLFKHDATRIPQHLCFFLSIPELGILVDYGTRYATICIGRFTVPII